MMQLDVTITILVRYADWMKFALLFRLRGV
jgi:hypothetical protein